MNLHFLKQCLAEILLTGRVGHRRLDRFYRLYLKASSARLILSSDTETGNTPGRLESLHVMNKPLLWRL